MACTIGGTRDGRRSLRMNRRKRPGRLNYYFVAPSLISVLAGRSVLCLEYRSVPCQCSPYIAENSPDEPCSPCSYTLFSSKESSWSSRHRDVVHCSIVMLDSIWLRLPRSCHQTPTALAYGVFDPWDTFPQWTFARSAYAVAYYDQLSTLFNWYILTYL